jgi:hypothetical protein
MICTLSDVQKQIIDPARDLPFRFIQMLPPLHSTNDDIKINIEALHFLLETDDRSLLSELVREESRYHSAMGVFNERSRLHREEVQPLLERDGFVEGGYCSPEQFEKVLGKRLCRTIQQATEATINQVDKTIISLQQFAGKFRDSLKKQYPTDTIIHFKIADVPNESIKRP